MAFLKFEKMYTIKEIVGTNGRDGFLDKESPKREPAKYSDYEGQVDYPEVEDVKERLCTKKKLLDKIKDPSSPINGGIRVKEGEEKPEYDHLILDLSSYATEEERKAVYEIVGDCLRNPDFDFNRNQGEKGIQNISLRGSRAVLDMGIHENTGYTHAHFLVMHHTVEAETSKVQQRCSMSKAEFSNPQIEEINKALRDRGFAELEAQVRYGVEVEESKPGTKERFRRPEKDTLEAAQSILGADESPETANPEQVKQSIEETIESFANNRDQSMASGIDDADYRRALIRREHENTRGLIESKIEEIARLKSNAAALELAYESLSHVKGLRENLAQKTDELNKANEGIEKLKEVLVSQKDEISVISQEKEVLENSLIELEGVKNTEIQGLKEELKEVSSKLEEVSSEFDSLSEEKDLLQKEFEGLAGKNAQLELDLDVKTQETETLKGRLKEVEEKLLSAENLISAEKEARMKAENQVSSLSEKLEKAETEFKGLRKETDGLRDQVNEEKLARSKAEGKLESLETSFKTFQESAEKQFESMQKRFDEQIKMLKSETKETKKALDTDLKEAKAETKELATELAKADPSRRAELNRRFGIGRTKSTQKPTQAEQEVTVTGNKEDKSPKTSSSAPDKDKDDNEPDR